MQETCLAFIDTFCTHVFLEHPLLSLKNRHPAIWAQGVQWFWVIAKFSRVKHQAFTTGVLPVRKSKWYLKYAVFLRHKKETHHASSYPCDVGSKTLWTTLPPHQILAANDTCSPRRTGFCLLTGWQWYSYPPPIPQTKKLHRKLTCLERNNYCLCQLFFWVPTVAGA